MSIKVREENNQELAEALTAEGGPLQHGMLPDNDAAGEAGKKALAESIANAAVAAAAKAKPGKAEKTEKAEPKTLLESGPWLGQWWLIICGLAPNKLNVVHSMNGSK